MFAKAKREWKQFRASPPGERFEAYHERVKHERGAATVVRLVLGILLTLAGIVMLFVPGPGILFIFFGLALVGARSRPVASALDATELWMRKAGHGLKAWLKKLPWPALVGLGVVVLAAVAAAAYGMWRWLAA